MFFTDSISLVSEVNVECPIGNRDHYTIHFTVNLENHVINNDVDFRYYNYKDADYDSLNYYMSCIKWDYEFSFVFTTEEYWNIF